MADDDSNVKKSRTLRDFIQLMCLPPSQRDAKTMATFVYWLSKRCPVLKHVDIGSMMELLKHSSYLTAAKNEVVFLQGQPRQHSKTQQLRFFIVLKGCCSMYVNPFLNMGVDRSKTRHSGIYSPEKMLLTSSVTPRPDRPDSYIQLPVFEEDLSDISDVDSEISFDARADTTTSLAYEDRSIQPTPASRKLDDPGSRFGRFVVSYEKGRYFGEAAFLTDARMCTASLVADEDCDFLVIKDDFFQHCIKEHHDREVTEVFDFVDMHPFFKSLSQKSRSLLQISLRKVHFDANEYVVRQAAPVHGLHFIVSGSVELTVDPSRHKAQYPQLWPFETNSDIYYREFEWMRESRRRVHREKYCFKGEVSLRRKTGDTVKKDIHICTIQAKEAVQATEVALDLKSHIYNARCLTDTEAYVLNLKTLRRVLNPRKHDSAESLEILRLYVQTKLEYRLRNPVSQQIPLMSCLYYEVLRESRQKSLRLLSNTKSNEKLLQREERLLEALEWFKLGKAPLVLQRDPSVIPMRENMRERARVRSSVKRATTGFKPFVRRGCTKAKNQREPRSIHRLRYDPVKDILEELEKSGVWKSPQDLDDFLRNYSRTPDEFDIRSQTNRVTEEELHLVKCRRHRNKLVKRFVKLLQKGEDPVPMTRDEAVMCQVLFEQDFHRDDWGPDQLPVIVEEMRRSALGRRSIATCSSNKTMQFRERRGATPRTLEMRIKDFHARYGAEDREVNTLPALRRYREFEAEESPKPGGKVFVTKVPCMSCWKNIHLKDHNHVHCQMLPSGTGLVGGYI